MRRILETIFEAVTFLFIAIFALIKTIIERIGEKIMAKRTKKETKEVTRIVKLEITAIEEVAVDEPLRSKEEVLEVLKRKLRGMVDDVKILDMKTFER